MGSDTRTGTGSVVTTQQQAGLRIDDAAQYLGISRRSVYRLIEAGELDRVKIGRRTVVLRESCDDYLVRLADGSVQ